MPARYDQLFVNRDMACRGVGGYGHLQLDLHGPEGVPVNQCSSVHAEDRLGDPYSVGAERCKCCHWKET